MILGIAFYWFREPQQGPPITVDLGNGVTMTLQHIPAGTFMMGTPYESGWHKWLREQSEWAGKKLGADWIRNLRGVGYLIPRQP